MIETLIKTTVAATGPCELSKASVTEGVLHMSAILRFSTLFRELVAHLGLIYTHRHRNFQLASGKAGIAASLLET